MGKQAIHQRTNKTQYMQSIKQSINQAMKGTNKIIDLLYCALHPYCQHRLYHRPCPDGRDGPQGGWIRRPLL